MSPRYQQITLDLSDPIGVLELARPETRNAMNEAMGVEIEDAVRESNARRSLRVLLVKGQGKAFAAGGDFDFIEKRANDVRKNNQRVMLTFYKRFLAIAKVQVPTIAVIHGAAIGAGLCFALACDMRLAAQGAKLGLNFVKLGLHPGMGATFWLPRLVGPAKASELLLTGRNIDAEHAVSLGMVNSAHAPSELDAAVEALTSELLDASPQAIRDTKASLTTQLRAELDATLQEEAMAQALSFQTRDLREGVDAFREKRLPNYGNGG